jgi:hypothetical protein
MMKEIQNLINEKFEAMVNDGTIEKVIESKLSSCINDVFESAFRSYGSFTKHFEKQVEASIEQGMFKLELEPYVSTINTFVKQKLASHLEGEALQQIGKSIDSMFNPVPSEITMQEMVNMVQEAYKDDDYDGNQEHLSMDCEASDYGWFTLKFWKNKEEVGYSTKRTSDADIELHIGSDGELRWLEGGNKNYGAHNHDVESIFYRMVIKHTKITDIRSCDQDDFENTYIGIGEED